MRRIPRATLSSEALAWLREKTTAICALPTLEERRAEAQRLWKSLQGSRHIEEVRAVLGEMASGLQRCMYCEDSLGTDIDHFAPKAVYPERAFTWENYLLACSCCNSNEKREQFPLNPTDNSPLLIDPTAEDPLEHLNLTPSTGRFKERNGSWKGRETIQVFHLNDRAELVNGRRDAWSALEGLIILYGKARQEGSSGKALRIKRAIRGRAFASVFVYLLRVARRGGAARAVRPECLDALARFPEIERWGE